MRKSGFVALTLIVGTMAGAAGASVFQSPEGRFETFLGKLGYDPSTACTKPVRPYSDERYEWESYIDDGKRYLQCMQNAAESDAKYANRVIADGLREKSEEFVNEVDRSF